MSEMILSYEPWIRMGCFVAIFTLMALWEVRTPRRKQTQSRRVRWPGNLGIVVLNTLLLRVTFPVAAMGVATLAERQGWGLLNVLVMPGWLAVLLAVIILDLIIYLQHVMFHAVPAFWRLHRMHHADLDFDVTTAARFHPVEILLSMLIKMGAVAALGVPVLAVLLFEVLLNATATFNHSNVSIPRSVDRILRWFIVTPDMHRVHHSIIARETNSNFGFNLPWWDRLMGTYQDQPEAGHENMTIGLTQFRNTEELRLDRMLLQPFRDDAGAYPLNRR